MEYQPTYSIPSFLGIQISNSDVIPIDVRYIDNKKVVFSIPQHNAKQEYHLSGFISDDVSRSALKMTLNPFLKGFTDAEKTKFQKEDLNSESTNKRVKINPINNQFQNNYPDGHFEPFSYENENLKPSYEYKIPIQPFHHDDCDIFDNIYNEEQEPTENLCASDFCEAFPINDNEEDRKVRADALFYEGIKFYQSDSYNKDINVKGLKMLRQAQILYHEIYPESFKIVVLPGVDKEFIKNLDPDAEMISPKRFVRFMKRRLELAQLKSKGLIKKRTSGVLYPSRSAHAKKRVRDECGLFVT